MTLAEVGMKLVYTNEERELAVEAELHRFENRVRRLAAEPVRLLYSREPCFSIHDRHCLDHQGCESGGDLCTRAGCHQNQSAQVNVRQTRTKKYGSPAGDGGSTDAPGDVLVRAKAAQLLQVQMLDSHSSFLTAQPLIKRRLFKSFDTDEDQLLTAEEVLQLFLSGVLNQTNRLWPAPCQHPRSHQWRLQ